MITSVGKDAGFKGKKMKKNMMFLFYIAILCLFYIFLYKLILIKHPELFTGGAVIGEVFYQFSMTFILSLVFYYLVSYRPLLKDKRNIYIYANRKKGIILRSYKAHLEKMIEEVDVIMQKNPSNIVDARQKAIAVAVFSDYTLDPNSMNSNDFRNLCLVINPNSQSPFSKDTGSEFIPYTWLESMKNNIQYINKQISDLLILIPHLSPEHINLLTKIQDCTMVSLVLNKNPIIESMENNFENIHSILFDFHKLLLDLEEEWDKHAF